MLFRATLCCSADSYSLNAPCCLMLTILPYMLELLTHTRHNLAASMYSFWSKYWHGRWHWDKILKETLPSMLSWEMVQTQWRCSLSAPPLEFIHPYPRSSPNYHQPFPQLLEESLKCLAWCKMYGTQLVPTAEAVHAPLTTSWTSFRLDHWGPSKGQAAGPSVCHSKWFFEKLVDLHF